jgi:hypothetical protein
MWVSQEPGGKASFGVLGWGSGPWVRIGIRFSSGPGFGVSRNNPEKLQTFSD